VEQRNAEDAATQLATGSLPAPPSKVAVKLEANDELVAVYFPGQQQGSQLLLCTPEYLKVMLGLVTNFTGACDSTPEPIFTLKAAGRYVFATTEAGFVGRLVLSVV
jgi:hypothetical protein